MAWKKRDNWGFNPTEKRSLFTLLITDSLWLVNLLPPQT